MTVFYLLVGIMPLTRHWFWSETMVAGLTMNKLLGLLCLAIACLEYLSRHKSVEAFRMPQTRLFICFALVTIASFLTRGPSTSLQDSPVANFVSFLLLAFITLVLVNSVDRLRWTILFLIGGLVFVCLHAIREWQAGGLSADARAGWVGGDPNYLALSILLVLPIAHALAFRSERRWERLFCLFSLGIMLLAFMIASSRGGFIALLATVVFIAWRSGQRIRYLAVGGPLFAVLLVLSPSSPLGRFLEPRTGDQSSNLVRIELLKAGVKMFAENMLVGVGVGNFKPLVGSYGGPNTEVQLKHLAHNTYLEVAAEQGTVGVLMFVALLYTALRALRRIRQQPTTSVDPLVQLTAAGVEGGLVGAATALLFLSALHVRLFWFTVMVSACMPALAPAAADARRGPRATTLANANAGRLPTVALDRKPHGAVAPAEQLRT